MERIYFRVPFNDSKAYDLGARWDKQAKCWYAQDEAAVAALDPHYKRVANPHPISELPGEDRAFGGSSLFIDLVPSSCWFTNVRTYIERDDWERLAKGIRARAGQHCEICGAAPDAEKNALLDAHERWSFNNETGVQRLERIICVCVPCHRATHFGRAMLQGQAAEVREHYKAVNGCDDAQLDRDIGEAFALWHSRNRRTWTLDLSIILDAGIRLRPVHSKDDRPEVAEQALERHLEYTNPPVQGGCTMRVVTLDDLDKLPDV